MYDDPTRFYDKSVLVQEQIDWTLKSILKNTLKSRTGKKNCYICIDGIISRSLD